MPFPWRAFSPCLLAKSWLAHVWLWILSCTSRPIAHPLPNHQSMAPYFCWGWVGVGIPQPLSFKVNKYILFYGVIFCFFSESMSRPPFVMCVFSAFWPACHVLSSDDWERHILTRKRIASAAHSLAWPWQDLSHECCSPKCPIGLGGSGGLPLPHLKTAGMVPHQRREGVKKHSPPFTGEAVHSSQPPLTSEGLPIRRSHILFLKGGGFSLHARGMCVCAGSHFYGQSKWSQQRTFLVKILLSGAC